MSDEEDEVLEGDVEDEEEAGAGMENEGEGEEKGEEDEAHEEEEEEKIVCPLSSEIITEGLSLLCKTSTGLGHAYVRLELSDKGLTDILLVSKFIHLRFIDISSNFLNDLSPLASLTHLLWIKADVNQLTELQDQKLEELPYLQWLNLSSNRIKVTSALSTPALEVLNLSGNQLMIISGLDYGRLSNLVTLELRGNQLETTDGIYLPNLRKLYLAQNMIKHLNGLDHLEKLTTLHLRDNQIESLEGIGEGMKSLQYLNLRGNLVPNFHSIPCLAPLSGTLRALVLSDNPLCELDDYRLRILCFLPLLERMDKDPVSFEEKAEAKERLRVSFYKSDEVNDIVK
ncbi:leucine-rich repeat-containing protein 23 [Erpetoichthys calabaricus]|uniref:leucine-rich repeat-containing protein 23 n=1 Tax=Erpetoichthys calabaricus TaxID=27687 RepID=UPI0022349EC1|nr:leucine-rich repeat-containing protein 23 [Erpetoichthys calabaricus]